MKKIIIFLFCLLVFINYTNAEENFIDIEESLKGDLWTNFQDDKNYSLKIPNKDKDNNDIKGITMNETCFIKKNQNIIILYDNAYTSGGGGGGGIDSSGTVSSGSATKTVKTILTIQNINKIENEKVYTNKEEILLKVTKDDCYIIKIWENDEGSNSPDKVLHTKILIGVNEICETGNGCNICDYNGSIFYYTGRFENGDTHNSLEYKLNVLSNKVCAKKSDGEGPEWYVKKGSDLTINYTEGSYYIPYSNESQKTVIFINEKLINSNKLPQRIDEDMKIELCIVNSGNNILYKDKISAIGVNIKIDNAPPIIDFLPEIKEKIWITEAIAVYATDDKTGIKSFKIEKEGNPNFLVTSEDGSKILLNEDGKYTITAEDWVGNQSQKTILIDKTSPSLKIQDKDEIEINENANGWFTNNKIKIQPTDEMSGIKDVFVNGNSVTGCFEITENGKYEIKATDNAGNTTGTKTIKLDNKPPVITKKALSYTKKGRLIDTITVEASIEEDNTNSGLSEQVYVKNGDILTQSTITKINENNKTINAKIENINRSETNKYKLKVEAKDNAGNESIDSYEDIVLPPEIKIDIKSKEIEKTSDGKINTVTKLNLKNYVENKSSYKNLKLQRFIYIDTMRITEENFTNYFTKEARNDWQEITKIKEIKSKEIEDGIYTDRIPTDSGFGHKETGYIISWEIENIFDEDGNPIREESLEIKEVTADNPGTVKIQIEGKDEKAEIDFVTGKMTEGKEGIQLASDGSIKIWISIEDLDSEPYEVEVSQMIKVNGISEGLSYKKTGFIQSGISGKLQNETGKEVYEKGKWIPFPNPEYLSYNRETCLYLKIKEGFAEDKSVRESGKIYLKAEPLDLGGFTLKVCEEADYNSNGITAQPFQNVKLELNGEGPNAEWNFDDGITVNGITVEHKWNQKPERTGPISEYTLKITYMGKEATIPVHITDTKIGVLYGDEVWYGKHEVLGKIKIKKDQTLKIGNSEGENDLEVLCIEDDNENFMGCFEVYGKLEINNGNGNVTITGGKNTKNGIIKETEENTLNNLYWKGIEVNNGGQAVINHAEISGSRRGIAVDQGGIAVLSNCIFKQNGIGLHILGKCDSQNLTVINNDEYGIKEEYGCNDNIIKSTIKDNTINWYSAETGVLSIDEINEQLGK